MPESQVVILGIDPGFAITGFGVILRKKDKLYPINYGCITTSKNDPFDQRLKQVHRDLKKIIKKYAPSVIAMESLFFYKNAKTAINVGQARGVLILTASLLNVPVFEYTPLQVKQAISSYGRADKKQVQDMVKLILNLKEIPRPDDAADALAIAVCCANFNDFSKTIN